MIRARTRDCLVHIPGVIPGELTTGPAGLYVVEYPADYGEEKRGDTKLLEIMLTDLLWN